MKREALVAAVVGLVPAVLAGADPRSALPAVHGGTDPLAQAAHLAHAVRHLPGTDAFWNAPWMVPAPFAQLYLDPMVGPSILARAVPGTDPAFDYHLALWYTVAGAVLAMAWCARRFGLARPFALGAGIVYAVGPYAAGHFHHLNQVPAPWLPLALGALWDLTAGRRPWRASAIFVGALALQASWSVYATAALVLAATVLVVGRRCGASTRWGATMPPMGRPHVVALLGTMAVLACAAIPYVVAAGQVEGFGRASSEALAFQARWFDLAKGAAPRLLPWPAHDPLRPALYPGLGLVLLAAAGGWRSLARRETIVLVAVAAGGLLFAFGRTFLVPFTDLEIPLPFMALQDLVWPLRALRDPSRFALVASWALTLLAAGGAQWLWSTRRALAIAVLVLVAVDVAPGPTDHVVVGEDAPVVEALRALPPAAVWIGVPAACDETQESARDARFMHWALASGTRVAGGATGFVPPAIAALRRANCAGPDGAALRAAAIDWLVTDVSPPADPTWTDGTWSIVRVADLPARVPAP